MLTQEEIKKMGNTEPNPDLIYKFIADWATRKFGVKVEYLGCKPREPEKQEAAAE